MQASKGMRPQNPLFECWQALQDRIANACARAGRNPESIRVVAVSKSMPIESLLNAYALGLRDFGENYWQEARKKITNLPHDIRWHYIGHLQTNKVKYLVGRFALIQSVDRAVLLQEIQNYALKLDIVQPVLIEVRLSEEPTRAGVPAGQVYDLVEQALAMQNIALQGLMGLAPYTDDEVVVRKAFRTLRQIYERLPEPNRVWLSMGMSHDFEIAIEEGTTMLRIGTALFGERH